MTEIDNQTAILGAVVIGRNEGQRLLKCLDALLEQVAQIVYVDSGSTDNSVADAQARGVQCIALDLSIPFTAARARNEGAHHLIQHYPELIYIQFIDGDCELQPDWVEKAYPFLEKNVEYSVVCGRRRERFPEQSVYNQLCDIEWDTPVGDAMACGGDALIRVEAFKQVNGYRDDLIAGEEPEMCFRLREKGWKIRRIDAEMVLHDADITRFSQWWNRAKRAGYAYAQGCYLHGHLIENFKVKEVRSIFFWAFLLPIATGILSLFSLIFFLFFLFYPIQVVRITIKQKQLNRTKLGWTLFYAIENMLAKFPQLSGIIRFYFNTIKGKAGTLIEYK